MFVYLFCAVPNREGNGYMIIFKRKSNKGCKYLIWTKDGYVVPLLLLVGMVSHTQGQETHRCRVTGYSL